MTGIFWSSNLRAQHLRWLQLVHFPKPHEPENQGDPKSSNGVQDGWIIRWVPDPGSREMIHPRSWNGSPLKKLVLGVDYVDYFPDLGFDNLMKGLSPSKKLERRVTCKMWQADLAWLVAETWGTHEKNIWCLNTYIYLYKHVYIYIHIYICMCIHNLFILYTIIICFHMFHNFCEPKRRLRFVFGLSSQSFRDCWVQFEEKTCRSDGTNKLSPLGGENVPRENVGTLGMVPFIINPHLPKGTSIFPYEIWIRGVGELRCWMLDVDFEWSSGVEFGFFSVFFFWVQNGMFRIKGWGSKRSDQTLGYLVYIRGFTDNIG